MFPDRHTGQQWATVSVTGRFLWSEEIVAFGMMGECGVVRVMKNRSLTRTLVMAQVHLYSWLTTHGSCSNMLDKCYVYLFNYFSILIISFNYVNKIFF